MLHEYIPVFWSLIAVLAWFVTVMLQVYDLHIFDITERKKTRLRDKAHFAHSQNRGAA
jgi:hypothetical protein